MANSLLKTNSKQKIKQQLDQRNFETHRERVKTAKCSIDSTPPKIYPHVELKLKRLQLESDRLKDIESENRRLLKILVRTALKPPPPYQSTDSEAYKFSNQKQRIKESLRVVGDNERVVNRLISVKGSLDRSELDKSFTKHELRMRNISQYRHPWRSYNGDNEFLSVSQLTPLPRSKRTSRSSSVSNSLHVDRSPSADRDDVSGLPRVDSVHRRRTGSMGSSSVDSERRNAKLPKEA